MKTLVKYINKEILSFFFFTESKFYLETCVFNTLKIKIIIPILILSLFFFICLTSVPKIL
jgi:hypothetical protein